MEVGNVSFTASQPELALMDDVDYQPGADTRRRTERYRFRCDRENQQEVSVFDSLACLARSAFAGSAAAAGLSSMVAPRSLGFAGSVRRARVILVGRRAWFADG